MSLQSAEYLQKLKEITEAESQLAQLTAEVEKLGADAALMGASMLPPPAGTAADIASLGKDLVTGDWSNAFWDAVGIIPIVGDGAKAAAKDGKIANRIADIKKAIAKANEAIQKKKDELAQLCKKNRLDKKDKTAQATKDCDTAGCGKDSDKNGKIKKTKTTKEKINDLKSQGHGPQRHEGDVTEEQLDRRARLKEDPETGTRQDKYQKNADGTPKNHKCAEHATKVNSEVNSEESYIKAEEHSRNDQVFKDKATSGEENITVETPLKDIYGDNYKDHVSGRSRTTPLPDTTTPTVSTNFEDGYMRAIYQKNSQGDYDLVTMYPNPK